MDKKMSLTVLIPAFNEEENIGQVIDEIRSKAGSIVDEILVVDDGSADRTSDVAMMHNARVIRLNSNRGYGRAIKVGYEKANSELVITVDADGQHDPFDIINLFNHFSDTDLIIGNRESILSSGMTRGVGKWLIKTIAEYLSHETIPDLNSGMKLGKTEELKRYVPICPDGMSFSDSLTLTYLSQHKTIKFFPINIRKRESGTSTINVTTAFETILSVLNVIMLFHPGRIFIPISMVFLVLGGLWAIPFALAGRGLSVGALLLILVGILIFFFGMIAEQISQIRKYLIDRTDIVDNNKRK
jgi:glycosyltransferase involved in cell wall biosynthesis